MEKGGAEKRWMRAPVHAEKAAVKTVLKKVLKTAIINLGNR
jgi:hypothetical protein